MGIEPTKHRWCSASTALKAAGPTRRPDTPERRWACYHLVRVPPRSRPTTIRRMAGIDALIFDLDGTLVDTLADITAAARYALAGYSTRRIEPADVRPWISHGARPLLAHLSGGADAATLDRLVTRFRVHYAAHGLDCSRLYDGWPAVLDLLAARRMPMCVLSNKPEASTQWLCGALLSRWRFHSVVGLREGIPPKPDPAGALEVIGRLGTDAARVAVIGDSPLDMQTARSAGCRAIAAGWGFHPVEELAASGAEAVLRTPRELLEFVGPL